MRLNAPAALSGSTKDALGYVTATTRGNTSGDVRGAPRGTLHLRLLDLWHPQAPPWPLLPQRRPQSFPLRLRRPTRPLSPVSKAIAQSPNASTAAKPSPKPYSTRLPYAA